MKLKLAFLCLLSLNAVAMNSSSSQSAPTPKKIKMPSADVLRNRLTESGLMIGEKTSLADDLGDKEMAPLVIAGKIEISMDDYKKFLRKQYTEQGNPKLGSVFIAQATVHMPLVFQAVFHDYPECLSELKAMGIPYAMMPEKKS